MSEDGRKKALKPAVDAGFLTCLGLDIRSILPLSRSPLFIPIYNRLSANEPLKKWRQKAQERGGVTLLRRAKIRVKKSCIYQSFILFFAAMKESIYRMYLTIYSAAVD